LARNSSNPIKQKAFDSGLVQPQKKIDALIIGAGAAGLAAWRELHAAGVRVAALEARDRIGGRILTEHSTSSPVELGAEFVHGKPEAVWSILEKAGLEVTESSDTRMVFDQRGLRPCADYWKIIQKVNGQIDPTLEISYDHFLTAARASPFEKIMAKSYVEGFNAARANLISASAIATADREAVNLESQRQFRLKVGYGSLIAWLAKGLPSESLHLQTAVQEIRWRPKQVEVVADTANGKQTFSAARLIVTVPLGVLRASPGAPGAIQFFPPLPEKEAALKHLEVGHAIKLMIRFKERFWERAARFAFAISFDADVPVWWTQEPQTSNLLTGWAGGPPGERLINLSREKVFQRGIDSLSRIFAQPASWLQGCAESIYYHNWSNDPFSRGAYSYPKAGGLMAAQSLAEPVEGVIFFAGEATDFQGANGTVHAALSSGISAARKIVGAL
jgi:monoamine oxidase